MRRRRSGFQRLAAVAITTLAPLAIASAEPTNAELLQRIDELSQKILVLERKIEIDDDATKAAATTTATVKASPKGFAIQSADSQNVVKVRGTVHIDGRFFESDDPSSTPITDSWVAQRVRPTIEGTLGGIYDFKFMPDFGQGKTVIQDAYVTGRFMPGFQVTAGKFKMPVGLERLQSANDIRFVTRGFPTSIAPNRDLGVQVGGNVLGERLNYALAWSNGANDGGSSDAFADTDPNSAKEWSARLFALPFGESEHFALRGLGLGLAGTRTTQDGTLTQPLLSSYKTSGNSTFFSYRTGTTPTLANGERTRLAPQFYYYVGRFGLLGEWTQESQDVIRTTPTGQHRANLDTTAWQLAASMFLTGEEEAFRGFKPNNVFSLADHTWGALELVARYHELDADDAAFLGGTDSFADPAVSASKASAWTVGLNWYLNDNLKWVFDYEQTSFDGGAPSGDREDEKVFLTRFALGF
jgi:phosphate-selective porin OprO/OprP